MRVCIVNEFFHPDNTGGTGTVLSDLARTLRRNHPDVSIDVVTSRNLYRDKTTCLPKTENWNGINIHRLATPHTGGTTTFQRLAINSIFSLFALWTLLTRRPYDLVIIGTAPPSLAVTAHALKKITGTPYFYVIYDLDPDRAVTMGVLSKNSPIARILRRAQKRWLHAAAKTIVLGRCMQEYLANTYLLPSSKTVVIPIGADADEIVPGHKQSRFRQKHALTGFIVSYSGNFGRYHDFDTILNAAKQLHELDSNITFMLCGEGAQKAHVEQRIAAEQIENVRVFPLVDKADYVDALATADVSLVTLERGMEGLCVPSKFYSILASARPVVALVSPISEVALVIKEDDCGIQIDQGDTDKLVEAISFLAANPTHSERLGENARRTLVTKYSTQRIAEMYYRTMRPSRFNLTDKTFTTAPDDRLRTETLAGQEEQHSEMTASGLPR